MAISKIPDELSKSNTQSKTVSEESIQKFINKGGKPTESGAGKVSSQEPDGTKSIKLILTNQEMSAIKELRSKRPSRNKKIPISIHDWVIEAVREKINKDQKKHNLTLL